MRLSRLIPVLVLLGGCTARGQFVQSCTASTANTNPSCTLPSPVVVGHKLVALVIESDTSAPPYSVTDTQGNTFSAPGVSNSPQWTVGFNGAQCGAGADGRNFCFNQPYVAPITTGGSDTVTYVSAGNTPDVYWLYVGEYAGLGGFDVTASTCSGGALVPCNGGATGGSQSTLVTTSTSNSIQIAIAACDVNVSLGVPGCTSFPSNSTGTLRAQIQKTGGCCSNGMKETVFDSLGGPPGTYTATADFGIPTNWVLTVWSFGFSPATRVNHRSLWEQ